MYEGERVKIINLEGWRPASLNHMKRYVARTGVVKTDWREKGFSDGFYLTIEWDDSQFEEEDQSRGKVCFRYENIALFVNGVFIKPFSSDEFYNNIIGSE